MQSHINLNWMTRQKLNHTIFSPAFGAKISAYQCLMIAFYSLLNVIFFFHFVCVQVVSKHSNK